MKLTHIILGICLFTSFLEIITKHVIISKNIVYKLRLYTLTNIYFLVKKNKQNSQYKEKIKSKINKTTNKTYKFSIKNILLTYYPKKMLKSTKTYNQILFYII